MKVSRIVNQIEKNLNRVQMIPYMRKDGTRAEFPSAKRGNSTYARRNKYRLLTYKRNLLQRAVDNSIMFITLVIPNGDSYWECRDAWRAVSKALGPFIKALRKLGIMKYIATLEATDEGHCHAHILCRWDKPLQTKVHNGKCYLAEKELVSSIREKWVKAWAKFSELELNSHAVSIRICPNSQEADRAFRYTTKHFGIWSDITEPLHRIKNNTAVPHDSSKLLANFWGNKLRIRLYRTSRGLGKVERFSV